MKKPTCDCISSQIKFPDYYPFKYAKADIDVYENGNPLGEWYGVYLDLNYCPQCGKPYKDVE